jgi:negative regulator of flagellin synthesis FlgM
MKIDPSIKHPAPAALNESRSAKNTPPPGTPGADKPLGSTPTGDVRLSGLSTQIKEMEKQLAAIPVIDRGRVDAIKAEIASGQYKINPENIAAGLIDSASEMFRIIK